MVAVSRPAIASLATILWLATAAAQPKGARPSKPERATPSSPSKPSERTPERLAPPAKPEPTPPNGAKQERAEQSPDAAGSNSDGPTAPGDELGEPPKARGDAHGAVKLSPLTPNPNEFPVGGPTPPPVDFDRLLGDIAALRSRVAALTTTLFKSKLRVVVETRDSDARIEALSVTLDDGVVFAAPARFSAADEQVVYEHAVAPGTHVIGLDVARYDPRKREYRSWQSSKFSIEVPDSRLVEAHFVLEDDSDMAVDFPDDQDGEYELRVRLRARVTE